jgi:methionyl aminopeptidase
MHMAPDVPNVGPAGRGPRLVPGLVLAVEPMITLGSPTNTTLEDDWTVVTMDGSPAAHWEHTVAVTDSGPWVLTARDSGRAELERLGVEVSALAD